MRKIYKKEEDIQGIVPLYIFFKRVPEMEKTRIGDFRKNVTLKVIGETKTTDINLEQLKEYSEMLERFISKVKHILSK